MNTFRFLFAALLLAAPAAAEQAPKPIPPAAADEARHAGGPETAVLAGGCYWGMQAIFERVRGVETVTAGFSGTPSSGEDELIPSRNATPAESVRVEFDPAQITYGQLLQVFFSVAHDPTQVDRQGPDEGPQYRSAIFYGDDEQKRIAESYIAQLQSARVFPESIATEVEPLVRFRAVAESQQDYVAKHPASPYVVEVDLPRLAAMKAIVPALYREQPLSFSSASE